MKNLCLLKGYTARKLLQEFLGNSWNKGWGTGIKGLMRGMATLPKVTRSY